MYTDRMFSHLVHASDADQAEALLTRWGPDGLGKLGGPSVFAIYILILLKLNNRRSAMGKSHY